MPKNKYFNVQEYHQHIYLNDYINPTPTKSKPPTLPYSPPYQPPHKPPAPPPKPYSVPPYHQFKPIPKPYRGDKPIAHRPKPYSKAEKTPLNSVKPPKLTPVITPVSTIIAPPLLSYSLDDPSLIKSYQLPLYLPLVNYDYLGYDHDHGHHLQDYHLNQPYYPHYNDPYHLDHYLKPSSIESNHHPYKINDYYQDCFNDYDQGSQGLNGLNGAISPIDSIDYDYDSFTDLSLSSASSVPKSSSSLTPDRLTSKSSSIQQGHRKQRLTFGKRSFDSKLFRHQCYLLREL